MKSTLKLVRRFIGILLLSSFLILVLNMILLLIAATVYANTGSMNGTWSFAEEAANAITQTDGVYALDPKEEQKLIDDDTWAMFIDNATLEVVWHSSNLPEEIPLSYTAGELSAATRGYIKDYPTATSTDKNENGLMILGFPKDSYWKHMNPMWDYDFIKNSPLIVVGVFAVNAALIMLIYVIANARLLRSVKSIVSGIEDLPTGRPVYIKEKGLLSDEAVYEMLEEGKDDISNAGWGLDGEQREQMAEKFMAAFDEKHQDDFDTDIPEAKRVPIPVAGTSDYRKVTAYGGNPVFVPSTTHRLVDHIAEQRMKDLMDCSAESESLTVKEQLERWKEFYEAYLPNGAAEELERILSQM